MDIAAAIQTLLEEVVFHVLHFYKKETGLSELCLAGGVAHNCTLNGKILRSGLFERVFVQPAAHDAGTALGACCAGAIQSAPESQIGPLRHLYLGGDIGDAHQVAMELAPWEDIVTFTRLDDTVKETAKLIDSGAVIGWVQGKSEFGPRALGNRSIIADPRPAAQKDRINAMVKKREAFRPFAPSVVAERAAEFFDIPCCAADLSHMTYVVSVKEPWRSGLAAITHIDGTARIQTVTRDSNERYWELLHEVSHYIGYPILLNTSFNSNCEPIVESVEDAIVCYLTTGIDYLIVGDYLVKRRHKRIPVDVLLSCFVELPETRRLVKQASDQTDIWYLEETKGDMRGGCQTTPVSELTALILSRPKGKGNLGTRLKEAGCSEPKRAAEIADEVVHLWTRRLVRVRPSDIIGKSDGSERAN
jgi:carbamoyltransferase